MIDNKTVINSTYAGERMMSVCEVSDHPQLISTNRHIMQGYLDVENVQWDTESTTLSGTSHLVGQDPYIITVATNGSVLEKATGNDPGVKISFSDNGNET